MVWGADVPADDWHKLGPREVARRAVQRLEYKGKGILLLHDIHQRTVEALPLILEELKARGFRVVHVVPASAERASDRHDSGGVASALTAQARRPGHPGRLVQDFDADILTKKSAEELCSLTAAHEAVHRDGAPRPRTHGADRAR